MTKIEWTDDVWNVVTGCTKISAGCKHCYAERIAKRFWGDREFGDVQCHPERLNVPLKWRKPRRVFVNSMSDLFHEKVPFSFLADVFRIMTDAPQHTFQILTKRPRRMQEFFAGPFRPSRWPLANVYLGVSIEDQKTADKRIPLLLTTPAALRFISAEPLLESIDLLYPDTIWPKGPQLCCNGYHCACQGNPIEPPLIWGPNDTSVSWIIVGGESGLHARPCNINWIYSIIRQCREAKLLCFVKQLGSHVLGSETDHFASMQDTDLGWRANLKHPKGGDISEWPADLRVREISMIPKNQLSRINIEK